MTTTAIPHPLRLARGSHQPGSGKGCAMNVVSYVNGDTEITDYPACSAGPLARLVQRLNDRLAGPDGYLSPENSLIALDLGWLTVGTADVAPEVGWWLAELLTDERVVRNAEPGVVKAIRRVAALCMRQADGSPVSRAEWRALVSSCRPHSPEISTVAYGFYGHEDAAGAAAAHAADAAGDDIDFTRWAITRWRELAGVDQPAQIDATTLSHQMTNDGETAALTLVEPIR